MSAPLFTVAAVGDAIFDSLCPGIRFTAEDDARYAAAARAALEACEYQEVVDALEALFASYKQLVDSGDAGFWKLEDQDEGKQALVALKRARGDA